MTTTNKDGRILLTKHREDYLAENAQSSLKPLGLYLHIPFCVRKCNYCDFVSFPEQSGDVIEAYVGRLCEDIAAAGETYGSRYHVDTVFIGGGTPSLLTPQQLQRILQAVDDAFLVGCEFAQNCGAGLKGCDGLEISMESNPGTFDAEKLRAFIDAGVNRLSIGVQSLDDGVLRHLGRIHDAETALKAMRAAKSLNLNYNVDLMLGIPGQTLAVWEDTLKRTIAEEPKHISFYSLQLEMGTPFYRDFKEGRLTLPEWSENREMYHRALEVLKDAGYQHYEISNAAIPGYECRHNLKYWQLDDYMGFGPGAHSCVGNLRYSFVRDLKQYMYGVSRKVSIIDEYEEISRLERSVEYLMLAMRTNRGIEEQEYRVRTQSDWKPILRALRAFEEKGWAVQEPDGRWHFTVSGFLLSNRLIAILIDAQAGARLDTTPWMYRPDREERRLNLPKGESEFFTELYEEKVRK